MKRALPPILMFISLLGMAVYFKAEDDAHNARVPDSTFVLERSKQMIDASWQGQYEVRLDSGPIDDEYMGTAKGPDGTVLRLIIRTKDGDVYRINGLHKDGIGASTTNQAKTFFERHPRLMLFTTILAFCFGLFGATYSFLGFLGLKRWEPQSSSRRRLGQVCGIMNLGLALLMAYSTVVQIQNWPHGWR